MVDSFSPAHFLLSSIIGELSKPNISTVHTVIDVRKAAAFLTYIR